MGSFEEPAGLPVHNQNQNARQPVINDVGRSRIRNGERLHRYGSSNSQQPKLDHLSLAARIEPPNPAKDNEAEKYGDTNRLARTQFSSLLATARYRELPSELSQRHPVCFMKHIEGKTFCRLSQFRVSFQIILGPVWQCVVLASIWSVAVRIGRMKCFSGHCGRRKLQKHVAYNARSKPEARL
jgi:hypothetical protein